MASSPALLLAGQNVLHPHSPAEHSISVLILSKQICDELVRGEAVERRRELAEAEPVA
jgi:hypothetical protein